MLCSHGIETEREENGIERDFLLSWDETEVFFRSANICQEQKVLNLISELRQRGYDKTLRAGQGMYNFMLSRSKQWGLRLDQPHITFNLTDWHYAWRHSEARSKLGVPYSFPTTIDIYLCNMNSEEKLTISDIQFTPEIDTILKQLESFPID